jgi:phage-related tail protein
LVEHFPAEVVVGQLGSGAEDDWQCFLRPNAIQKVVSMFKRKNSDPFKNAEAELDRLRSRRDELANRLHSAEAAAEVAVRAQREALVAEDLDGTAVKRAEDDCFRATFRRDALGDALEETERLLAEGEEELAADRDAAERAKAADDLVQRAAEIDVAAARFPEAVAAVADLHAAFIQLVQTKGLRFEVYAGLERSAEHIGFNTLHAALSALPVQVERRHPDTPPARGVREVVRDQLTDQMRALAQAIRTGSADLAENQPLSAP